MQGMPFVRIVLSVLFVVCTAATAWADTVRVIVDRALVWTQPTGVSIVMSQLLKDQTAEVVRRVGDWYEIVAPPGSGGGDRRTGFISASQVVLDSVGPPKEQPAPSLRREPPSPAVARPAYPGIFHIDALYRVGFDDFTRTTEAFTERFREEGSITANYGNRSGIAFGLLAGYSVWGPVSIGGGLDYYIRKPHVTVEAHVPHPFYFDKLRTGTFETEGLSAHEAAIHIPVMWTGQYGALSVMLYGGPTIFRVSQSVVTDLELDEQYPYDAVKIVGVKTDERKGTLFGYHAGADVSYFFSRTIGVGGGVRYSHANLQFDNDDSAAVNGTAGAATAAAGLRVKF